MPERCLRRAAPWGVALALSSGTAAAASTAPLDASASKDSAQARRRLPAETPLDVGPAYRLVAGVALGRGLRFNNPYRLQTELGDDARSLSLSATYADVELGAMIEGQGSLAHGVSVHDSIALDGIPQEVVTPSYVLLARVDPRWALVGRVGIPVVVEPDVNLGLELAGGGAFFLTASFGIQASVVGSLFYGAATLDAPRTAIPMLSLEAGFTYAYEVLP